MSGEKERVDGYLATIERLEPDIHMIDASAFYASAAISLKRIADAMTAMPVSPDGFAQAKRDYDAACKQDATFDAFATVLWAHGYRIVPR